MNENKSKKSGLSFSSGIGSSSILVIFVILCLVSFATLSIVSANADYKLSKKVLDRTTAYYEAEGQAQASLAALDAELSALYESSSSETAYFKAAGEERTFSFPLSNIQTLKVVVRIQYPKKTGDTFYSISSWQTVITSDLDYEGTLNVIQ
ncbi:MAG: hypothetical protein K2I22_10325 [Lachnospiraceae bacterium]|nr:hypothetical protein [Lachnospiraceae bacterium]